jgi:hypothetical protein
VRRGQRPAGHVVDRYRAGLRPRHDAVDEHERDAALDERVEVAAAHVRRCDEHAADPLLHEQREVLRLLPWVLAAVAYHHPQAGRARDVFGPAGHFDEERVRHVQHQQSDNATAARPELARTLGPYIAEFLDGRQHQRAVLRRYHLRPVDDIGHGAQRHARPAGHVLDGDHARLPRPDLNLTASIAEIF